MSQDVFELVQQMDFQNIELQLALQCAPVIAGLKISNLLIISKEDEYTVEAILRRTGISFYRLLTYQNKVTLLLYRRHLLEAYIEKAEVKEVFVLYGYQEFDLPNVLGTFGARYQNYREKGQAFPHEMGLILGYPVCDVVGFIENQGKNYLYSGYWKVYQNLNEMVRLFEAYERAEANLVHLISKGVGMREIMMKFGNNVLQNKEVS